MSNDIYGYVRPVAGLVVGIDKICSVTTLGIKPITSDDLYGFGSEFASKESDTCFVVTDGPRKTSASYLVDGIDYVNGSPISLPVRSADRLALLADFVTGCFNEVGVGLVALAVTDSSYVEDVLHVSVEGFGAQLLSDVTDRGPPDRLYLISEDSSVEGMV